MTMFKMPVFSRASLCANILIIASFPILTVTIALLTLDRYTGTHFFTNDMGGNMMMYINLIWAWGHPEVYILVLPVFGVFSKSPRPSRVSVCSVTPLWYGQPSVLPFCRSSFGCTTSSPWVLART
nr:Ubiquinol oxidase subunit 1 [Klebsiella pneumoniae]